MMKRARRRMAGLLCLLALLVAFPQATQAQSRTLSGTVRASDTGESLPYAAVTVQGSALGTATNTDGRFALVNVSADTLTLRVSYLGYLTAEFEVLPEMGSGPFNILLQPATSELDEVLVVSEQYNIMKVADGISQITISPKELAVLPSIGEIDIFRSLQLMPGVSATNEGSSGLYVRGGTPDQNLVVLDGMTIYHVDHFFGFFSAFNADAIKDVQLYKGGYPARFGGRTSSVIELTGKSGDASRFRAGGGINLLSASSVVEIPLQGKGSILISGRRSYTDVIRSGVYNKIFGLFNDDPEPGVQGPGGGGQGGGGRGRFANAQTQVSEPGFFFYDLNAKATYRPSGLDVLAISFYNGKDDLDKSRDQSRTIGNENFQRSINGGTEDVTDWGNIGMSAKWSRQWAPRFYSNALVAYSEYFSDFLRHTALDIMNPATDSLIRSINRGSLEDNAVTDFTLSLDNEWQAAQKHMLAFGVKHTQSDVSYQFVRDDTLSILDRNQAAQQTAVYLQDSWQVTPGLELSLGGRAAYYNLTDQLYLEPRASFVLHLTDRIKLKGAYGRFHQFVNRVVNENVQEGSRDFWLLADGETIPISESEHLIAGIAYETPDYLFDIEGYQKNLDGLSEFSLRFRRSGFNQFQADELFFSGDGVSRGLEFLIQKKRGQHTGWISYTLAEVDHTFPGLNDGDTFPALHDQRHEFNGVYSIKLGDWTLSSTFIFASGKPYTAPESEYFINLLDGTTQSLIHIGDKNGLRLPAYHRLDISGQRTFEIGNTRAALGISIFNVYNRTNVWYREFDLSEEDLLITDVTYLGFTPNLSFRIDL